MSTKIEDVLATWDHSGKSYGGIGKCTAVFKVKLHNETNRFICAPAIIVMATDLKDLQTKTGFFILFFNEKEIQSLIDILDLKLSAGKTVQASETVVQSCPAGAVDLGLKTQDGKKLYWASCNLGATAPEEFGDYYAWGELETKTDNVFSRDNYKWMKKEGWNYLYTKYNNDSSKGDVDNKIDLDPEDDVAHVKMGGNWHIPTPEEHQRLVTNLGLVWEWTTLNGIYGYKVTSNISGYEGNWIFLPAAGCRGADRLVNEDMGIYLLSRLREAPEDVNVFSFREISKESDPSAWRFNGFPIRPVYTE